jgi:hypothetical protein
MLSETSMASMIDDLAQGSVSGVHRARRGEQPHREGDEEQRRRHVPRQCGIAAARTTPRLLKRSTRLPRRRSSQT